MLTIILAMMGPPAGGVRPVLTVGMGSSTVAKDIKDGKPFRPVLTVGMGSGALAQSLHGNKGKGKGSGSSWGYNSSWSSSSWSSGGWSSGPYERYEKSEKQKEEEAKKLAEEAQQERWRAKQGGQIAPVDWLLIPASSDHVKAGLSAIIPAMEYNKAHDVYANGHKILQDFFTHGEEFTSIQDICDFEYDEEMKETPEVYAAWKEAGNFENGCTIATCLQCGQWAAGFGSKDKSVRAAKLALAVALALALDPTEFARVGSDYPDFATLCYNAQKTHPLVLAQQAAVQEAAVQNVVAASASEALLQGIPQIQAPVPQIQASVPQIQASELSIQAAVAQIQMLAPQMQAHVPQIQASAAEALLQGIPQLY